MLLQDAREHPDKYEPDLLPLVESLGAGTLLRADLTDREKTLLDRATLDFATYIPPKTSQDVPTSKTKIAAVEVALDDDWLEEGPIVGQDIPEGGMPAYWWL